MQVRLVERGVVPKEGRVGLWLLGLPVEIGLELLHLLDGRVHFREVILAVIFPHPHVLWDRNGVLVVYSPEHIILALCLPIAGPTYNRVYLLAVLSLAMIPSGLRM